MEQGRIGEELNPQILVCEVKILLLSIIKDILT